MNIIVAVLLLGFIIIIHELGHFLLAKKNGITVTEFSIGMGPRIASFVKNNTRYSLKVFPFGGSCMMLGEDETVEDDGAFHKKSVWARFSVIFGGAFFNFILAFILALIVVNVVGVDKPFITKVAKDSPAAAAQLQEGDLITKINGRRIHFSREVSLHFVFHPLTEEAVEFTYKRDGKEFTSKLTPKELSDYMLGFTYSSELPNAEILELGEGGPLAEAGMAVGDIIVNINGTKIGSGQDLLEYLKEHPLADQPIMISYLRAGNTTEITATPRLVTSHSLGLGFNGRYEKVSPVQTVMNSFYEIKYNIRYALDSLGYLISGRASVKDISGPVGIVNVVGQIVNETEDYGIGAVLISLASFCILISTNLGVMNLLPLPALDGGRLVFLLIEAVRGKPVPKEKEAMVHFVGMALLMVLMVFVLYNDIRNIIG